MRINNFNNQSITGLDYCALMQAIDRVVVTSDCCRKKHKLFLESYYYQNINQKKESMLETFAAAVDTRIAISFQPLYMCMQFYLQEKSYPINFNLIGFGS